MKALVFTDIRQMTYQDVPDPEATDDEVVVRVKAAGFCGSELESFVGHSLRRQPPLIMGHEFSGEIAATGNNVSGLSIGQRVAVNPLISCGECIYCERGMTNACPNRKLHSLHLPGAFAEYIAIKGSAVTPISDTMPYEQVAMAEPLANGLHVTAFAGEQSREQVVIFGAGVIGLMCLQAAIFRGAVHTTVVDRVPGRLAVARNIGASATIDASREDVVTTVREKGGSDLAIDAVGAAQTRQQCIEVANPGSLIAYIGAAQTFTEINGHEIVLKELTIQGSYAYTDMDFHAALDFIEVGNLRITEFADLVPLADGHAAINRLIDEPDHWLKVILQP